MDATAEAPTISEALTISEDPAISEHTATAEHSAPGLVGRAGDVALLTSFLHRAADEGAALVLTGGPGVGRSALLDVTARAAGAAGTLVLGTAGVPAEAGVAHAGLGRLLQPVLGAQARLPGLHRDALAAVLGYRAGPRPDRLVVATAALALVREAAAGGPVLLVVDDLQDLDRASAGVLGFVGRRLDGTRTGLLAASRPGGDDLRTLAGLPAHEVRPLADPAAEELLTGRYPSMAPRVRRRVLAVARGNPLALRELPAALSDAQRRGSAALPAVLPLGRAACSRSAGRLDALPPATRRLLLVAALDGTGDLGVLAAASGGDEWLDALALAERAGLLHVDPDTRRVWPRDPLVGPAVVALATAAERRRAHAALAAVSADRPERRAWHLAEAAVGSDVQAADLLEEAASRALRAGDGDGAVTALLRAAELSPRGPDRARRLARAAATRATVTADLAGVPQLLLQARRADPDGPDPLPAATADAHHRCARDGDVDGASLRLARAIGAALRGPVGAGEVDDALREALHELLLVGHHAGRPGTWRALRHAATRLGHRLGPDLLLALATLGDPARTTATDLRRLDRVVAGIDAETDPARIVRTGLAALQVDRLDGCRQALWRVVSDGREGGAVGPALHALVLLSRDAHAAGRWEEARRTAEEAVGLGESRGHRLLALSAAGCLAVLAAGEGDVEQARARATEVAAWAGPRGVRGLEHVAARARALAALAEGDVEEAYRQVAAISPPGTVAPQVPLAAEVTLDLVEAAVRTGRHPEAEAHAAATRRLEAVRVRPRLALLAAGAAALTAADTDAAALFDRALAVPGAARYPFEHARVRLAHGEHLRRVRATGAARTQLAAALETFTRLGARPWAERAGHELRAAGAARPAGAAPAPADLTPQENEISQLAASGLTNKQIGAQLHLSPRTVGAHLYRVFPKLGITSRAALRDALTRAPAPG